MFVKVTGGKPIRDFSLQHKTFSTLNYARDFGATMKESLKRTRNRSGLPRLKKTRIVPCQIRSCLGQQSKLPLPPVQIVTREDKGLNRELLTCLTTNYKKRINSVKRDLYHQRHGTMSCYLLSF